MDCTFTIKTSIYCVIGCTRETAYKRKIKASHYFSGRYYMLSLCKDDIQQWIGLTIRKGEVKKVLEDIKRKNQKHSKGSDRSYLGSNEELEFF
ncbi:hypothetical protein H5410_035772 [Solanum commersonii]|uniref:Uncharacterized protein n=1 Tax=Solanum commersonii TaxID=4109 RepID=A0A9J5Y5Q1_SOLCO|nr:hypothetical protein H5410_035772 [Solanum commersonii]